jgi:hypothetical protein
MKEPNYPNYLRFNQKPIPKVSGLIVARKPLISGVYYNYHVVILAMRYKSIEERRKLYNDFKHRYKLNVISFIPD